MLAQIWDLDFGKGIPEAEQAGLSSTACAKWIKNYLRENAISGDRIHEQPEDQAIWLMTSAGDRTNMMGTWR